MFIGCKDKQKSQICQTNLRFFSLPFYFFTFLPFIRNVCQRLLQEFPEWSNRLDECTLRRGMWRLHRRTEAHDVKPGVLAQDDRTLQTSVVNLNDAVLTEQLLIFF